MILEAQMMKMMEEVDEIEFQCIMLTARRDELLEELKRKELINLAMEVVEKQLEDYGRTIGIELDRRLKKETLIKELIEHMAKKKGKSIIKKAKEAVKKKSIERVAKTIKIGKPKATNARVPNTLIVSMISLENGNCQ